VRDVFERDYLVRLLTQAGLVLGKAMGLRRQQKRQEALDLIDEFLGRELRLRSRLAMGLSDDDLLAMLSVTGNPNAEAAAVVAAFLQQEAELLDDLGRTEESVPRYAKALRLNLYAIRAGMDAEGWDIRARVEELLEALAPYEPDADTLRALWRWHEEEARFADAENALFELANLDAAAAEEGDAFYDRLSAIGDETLEAGGMDREELEESRRQWTALMKEKVS